MPTEYEIVGIARRYLALIRDALDMDVAWMSECVGVTMVIHAVEGDPGSFDLADTHEMPWCDCYSSGVSTGDLPRLMRDTRADSRTAGLRFTREQNVRAYAATPIIFPDGRMYGAIACFSSTPRDDLGAADERLLLALSKALGEELAVYTARNAARQERRSQIERVIDGHGLRMVAQPIVRLDTRQAVGVEALSRFDEPPLRPDKWFADAQTLGMGVTLELAAIRRALSFFDSLPSDVYVSINASPSTIAETDLHKLLATRPTDRIVLEVTEHNIIADYGKVIDELMAIRATGIRMAVDDAGAGYASFRHILNLNPDIIKLDRDMIGGVAEDPARRALVSALVEFATGLGASVVAEGIETTEELRCLRDLGIVFGQGYYIAKPAPLPLPFLRHTPMSTPALVDDDVAL